VAPRDGGICTDVPDGPGDGSAVGNQSLARRERAV